MPTFETSTHPKAHAILALLNSMELEDQCDAKDATHCTVYEWHNGREKGLAITVEHFCYGAPGCLTVTFGQHRCSDGIFVDTWVQDGGYWPTAPTTRDITEAAYENRHHFGPNAIGKATEYIASLVKSHMKACKAESERRIKETAELSAKKAKGNGKPKKGTEANPGIPGFGI